MHENNASVVCPVDECHKVFNRKSSLQKHIGFNHPDLEQEFPRKQSYSPMLSEEPDSVDTVNTETRHEITHKVISRQSSSSSSALPYHSIPAHAMPMMPLVPPGVPLPLVPPHVPGMPVPLHASGMPIPPVPGHPQHMGAPPVHPASVLPHHPPPPMLVPPHVMHNDQYSPVPMMPVFPHTPIPTYPIIAPPPTLHAAYQGFPQTMHSIDMMPHLPSAVFDTQGGGGNENASGVPLETTHGRLQSVPGLVSAPWIPKMPPTVHFPRPYMDPAEIARAYMIPPSARPTEAQYMPVMPPGSVYPGFPSYDNSSGSELPSLPWTIPAPLTHPGLSHHPMAGTQSFFPTVQTPTGTHASYPQTRMNPHGPT